MYRQSIINYKIIINMNKLLLLISVLLLTSVSIVAEKKDVTLTQTIPADRKNLVPNPPVGKRTPIHCIVDMDQKTIFTEAEIDTTSYEIWDAEGCTPMYVSSMDCDIVEFMIELKGEYQLRLVSDNYVYIGNIAL